MFQDEIKDLELSRREKIVEFFRSDTYDIIKEELEIQTKRIIREFRQTDPNNIAAIGNIQGQLDTIDNILKYVATRYDIKLK